MIDDLRFIGRMSPYKNAVAMHDMTRFIAARRSAATPPNDFAARQRCAAPHMRRSELASRVVGKTWPRAFPRHAA